MNEKDKGLVEAHGWEVECESPLELQHPDGSRATGQAAEYLIAGLREEESEKHLPSTHAFLLVRDFEDACYRRMPGGYAIFNRRTTLLEYIAKLENQ